MNDAAEGRPGALRAGVAIAQRAAAMDGLDVPTKVAFTPDDLQLEAIVQQMIERSGHVEVKEADVLELTVLDPDDDAPTYG